MGKSLIFKRYNENKSKVESKNYKNIIPVLFVLPLIAILLGVLVYPILSSILISMLDYTFTSTERTFVFLNNYIEVISQPLFIETTIRTFIWTGLNIIGMLSLGLYTAVILNTKFKGNFIVKAVILIPWILPQVVTGFTWSWMMTQDFGIINNFMVSSGLVEPGFSWFQSGLMAFIATIIANVWRGFPFFALMIYSKITSLSINQVESAKIDGANSLEVFIFITLPHIKGVLITCTILSFLWTFNAFDIIFVMTNGGPHNKTLTLPLLLQREVFLNMNLGNASSMAVFMLLMMIFVLLIFNLLRKLIIKFKGGTI